MNNKEIAFIREGTYLFFGKLFEKFIRYVLLASVTFLISPPDFGQFVFAFSAMSLIYKLGSGNLERAITYFVPQLIAEDRTSEAGGVARHIGSILIVITLLLTIAVILLAEPVMGLLDRSEDAELFIFVAPLLILFGMRDIVSQILLSLSMGKYESLMRSILFPLLRLILTVTFLLFFTSILALVLGVVFAWSIAIVVGAYILYRSDFPVRSGMGSSVSGREIFRYSAPLTLTGIVGGIRSEIDLLLLGLLASTGAPALFKIAFSVAALTKLPAETVKSIAKPLYAKVSNNPSNGELHEFYFTSARWTGFVTVMVSVIIIAGASPIIELLFDNSYSGASIAVPVLAFGMAFSFFFGHIQMFLEGTDNTDTVFFHTVIILVVNAVLDILLIPSYGILGAAVGTTVGIVAGYVYALYYITNQFDITPVTREQVVYLFAGAFAFIGASLIMRAFEGLVSLAVLLPTGLIIYTVITVVMKGFIQKDVEVARKIEIKIQQRFGWSPPFLMRIVAYGARE